MVKKQPGNIPCINPVISVYDFKCLELRETLSYKRLGTLTGHTIHLHHLGLVFFINQK